MLQIKTKFLHFTYTYSHTHKKFTNEIILGYKSKVYLQSISFRCVQINFFSFKAN